MRLKPWPPSPRPIGPIHGLIAGGLLGVILVLPPAMSLVEDAEMRTDAFAARTRRLELRIGALEMERDVTRAWVDARIAVAGETCRFWMESSTPGGLLDSVAVRCRRDPCEVTWAMDGHAEGPP